MKVDSFFFSSGDRKSVRIRSASVTFAIRREINQQRLLTLFLSLSLSLMSTGGDCHTNKQTSSSLCAVAPPPGGSGHSGQH